jgi:hypothetical protein
MKIFSRCKADTPRRTSGARALFACRYRASYDEGAIGVVNVASGAMLCESTVYVRAITGLHINQQRENLNHRQDEKCFITVHTCCIVYILPLFEFGKQYSVSGNLLQLAL